MEKQKNYYKTTIIHKIKTTIATPGWSVSDYVLPLKTLYLNLPTKAKKDFRSSLLSLLQNNECLEHVFDICIAIKLKEACPILMHQFMNPPKYIKYNTGKKYHTWTEGFRKKIIIALGDLQCDEILPTLITLIKERMRGKGKAYYLKEIRSYSVVMQVMTKLSPQNAAKYFGWWINKAQLVDRNNETLLKRIGGAGILESVPDIHLSGIGSSSIRLCIKNALTKLKFEGLKKWLKTVNLINEKDRSYLAMQLEYMLSGQDIFCNVNRQVKHNFEPRLLSQGLALLPQIERNRDKG